MSLECKVYQKELRSLGYGLPLYEPNPADYDHVRIGDVGIADRDGYFMRIFNCFARADHEINTRYGVPDDFEPLDYSRRITKARQALEPGQWYKSQHVHQIEGSIDFSSSNNMSGVRVNFTVSSQQGAALCLKHSAERKDSACRLFFRRYMLKHFESWENFIRSIGVEFELQDMVFVTGHDLTANWATATNVHRASRGSISLTIGDLVATAAASLSRGSESTLDVPVRVGPNPYDPSECHNVPEIDTPSSGSTEPFKDQCIFLRGYRVAKRPILPAKLRAAAGPDQLDMDRDGDTYADVVAIGFNPDEENQTDKDIVDHNFAIDLVFNHTNAQVAILDESDVCQLAKAAGNSTKQLALWSHEDFRAIGLQIEAEFDSQLQKTVGTLKKSPLEATASSSAALTVPPKKAPAADGQHNYKDDGFIGSMLPEKGNEAVSSSNKEQAIPDNEPVYEDDDFTDRWVSQGKGKEAASVPDMAMQVKESQSFRLPIVSGSDNKVGEVQDNVAVLHSTTLNGHNSHIRTVAFSPDGSCIASGSGDKTVRRWDAMTGKQIGEPLRGHDDWVKSVAFSPDGSRIASGSSDRTIRLWDAATGMQVGEPLCGHDGWVRSVVFSPDGRRVASGSQDETIRLWDAATGMQAGAPLRGGGAVESVAFSPDGIRIVSGSSDHTVRLWDSVTGTQLGEPLRGHNEPVNSVAFSPGGSLIASGSMDGSVRLWDAVVGMQIGKSLRGHDNNVLSIAFSPDGSRIASGSLDKTIRVWDVVTGMQVGEPLRGHNGWVLSVAFSPDGKHVTSGSDDETVRIWEIPETLPAGPQQ